MSDTNSQTQEAQRTSNWLNTKKTHLGIPYSKAERKILKHLTYRGATKKITFEVSSQLMQTECSETFQVLGRDTGKASTT